MIAAAVRRGDAARRARGDRHSRRPRSRPTTFNPRLGIEGGLSILGTTGIVRPYCSQGALRRPAMRAGRGRGLRRPAPVLVPGNIGAKAARRISRSRDEQLIEVGNAWGFVLDLVSGSVRGQRRISRTSRLRSDASGWTSRVLPVLGHPGKLAKLAVGHWDTHSARSAPATVARSAGCTARSCGGRPAESPTVEGIFAALEPAERTLLADALAGGVRRRCRPSNG